jgi:protein ImuB
MSLTEASALLAKQDQCQLQFEEHDPTADQRALQNLADWCQRYSPVVGLESTFPASSLLLDVGGSALRLGGERELIRRACCELAEQHLTIRAAIADTVGAAWAVAHFGALTNSLPITRSEFCAFLIVERGAAAATQALAPLPIEALRLDDDTTSVLHALGVRQIHQLLQLPRDGLATRFGDHLLLRLDQAMGDLAEPIIIYHSPPSLTIEHALEHPIGQLDALGTLVRQLLDRLAQRLRVQQRGVLQLECQLATAQSLDKTQSGSQPLAIQIGLFHPTASAEHLFELLQMQLENYRLPAPVQFVSLHANATAPLEQQQSALLNDLPLIVPAQVTHLINRLSSRLGNHAVVTAQLQAEVQPESAFTYRPLTASRLPKGPPTRRKPPGVRPLRLQPKLVALCVVSVIPDGPPISFDYCGATHRIACYWGPERIETGWWKGAIVRRDYFRVEDQHGRRFWIFRDLTNGDWFLHGVFG